MGKDFSPKRLEKMSGLKFIDKKEKGDVGRTGIYRGKLIPQGSASLACSFSEKERAAGKRELDTILQPPKVNYEHIKACGVEDIDLALIIGYTGDGTCWYLEHKELKKIVELGIGISIDWYHIEDESSYPDDLKEELAVLDIDDI
jgi:hypothetical protein